MNEELKRRAEEVIEAGHRNGRVAPLVCDLLAECERLEARVAAWEDAMREVRFSLSVGGYNSPTIEPETTAKSIHQGIDLLTAPLQARIAELEGIVANAKPAPFDIVLNEDEATTLRDMIGDDEAQSVRLKIGTGHSGHGLYVSSAEYPDEGAALVCEVPAPTSAPSGEPVAQTEATSEQFEADNDCVICPNCVHQFRAIPVNVQNILNAPPAPSVPDAKPVDCFTQTNDEWSWNRGWNACRAAMLAAPEALKS